MKEDEMEIRFLMLRTLSITVDLSQYIKNNHLKANLNLWKSYLPQLSFLYSKSKLEPSGGMRSSMPVAADLPSIFIIQ